VRSCVSRRRKSTKRRRRKCSASVMRSEGAKMPKKMLNEQNKNVSAKKKQP